MGYIGLLLNAPYKRDSMMGCGCGYSSYSDFFVIFCRVCTAKITRDKMRCKCVK
jgi:hypothetical protein